MGAARATTIAWLALVAATLASGWAVSHLGDRRALVGVIMALAVGKALVVFHRFMDIAMLRSWLRWLFVSWAVGCGVMIAAVAAFS